MELYFRKTYLDKIETYLNKQIIIVLTGQRRVGKSYMLKQFAQLKSQEANANIIYIDKEKREFDSVRTYQDLNACIDSKIKKDCYNYVLIDEIQDISEFERTLRSFRTDDNCQLIVTGSNAKMLSGELTTLIGGRYKEIYIQPLSYTEFLQFHSLDDNDDSLAKYLNFGGMPGLVKFGLNEEQVREHQLDIYNTALLKDVIMRNQIRNVTFLADLVRFMADNEGKLISASSISKFMKSQGENVTPSVIINYQKFLADAYMLEKVNRYDIRGKKIFESNDKFYFEDNGLRNAIVGGSRAGDIEKNIESVIYQHLIRLGYKVFVGQLQAAEIDFVCIKPDGSRAYVQASYIIADDSTIKREFGNLVNINDNYPKYVISTTPLVTSSDYNGIKHLGLRKFLTDGLS